MAQGTNRRAAAAASLLVVLALLWAALNSRMQTDITWQTPAQGAAAPEQAAEGWSVSQDLWLDPGHFALEWDGQVPEQVVAFAPDLLGEDNRQGVQLNGGGAAFAVDRQLVRVQVWAEGSPGAARLSSAYFYDWDGVFAAVVLAAALAAALAGPKTARGRAVLAVAAACVLAASLPLFMPGIGYGPDLHFHLTRIQGIADGLASGQFPVRIQPTPVGGKGYATSLLYPDLFLYPAALLRFAGVSLEAAWKFTLLAVNGATAALTAFAARRFGFGWFGALTACILYTLAPYRICNLYIRAALGEALAMAFLPVVALGFYQVVCRGVGGWVLLALGMTGVIQSHLISTGFCVLFGGLFCLANLRRVFTKPVLAGLFRAVGLALALNLWYILPWVRFSREDLNIFHLQFDVWDYALYPAQLFMSFGPVTGDAVRRGTLEGEMLLAPGLALLAAGGLLLLALGDAWLGGRPLPAAARLGAGAAGFAGLSLWLCTDLFPWALAQKLPAVGEKLAVIQFPWRFLATASLFLALGGGALAAWKRAALPRQAKALALTAVFCAALLPSAGLMLQKAAEQPSYAKGLALIGDEMYDTHYFYAGTSAGDLAARPKPIRGPQGLAVSGVSQRGNRIEFSYSGADGQAIELPLTWYPGYAAVDQTGAALACEKGENGILTVRPQNSQGRVTVWYRGLWYFRVGDGVSLAAALGLAARAGTAAGRKRKATVQGG